MSQFHSTVNRRDFLKVLGVGTAGLGAAALSAPAFHDLDEVISDSASGFSSTTAMQKRPWYVKEVDKATVEIDLTKRTTPFTGMNAATGVLGGSQNTAEENASKVQMWKDNMAAAAQGTRPGFTGRDLVAAASALVRAAYTSQGVVNTLPTPPQGFRNVPLTLASLGCPKWNGTPEENTYMLRNLIRQYGGGLMGIARIDNDFQGSRETMFNPANGILIDAEDYVMKGAQIGIPRKCKWAVVITDGNANTQSRNMINSVAYFAFLKEKYEWIHKVQNFLWGLGFQSYNVGDAGNPATPSSFWGYVSGVGEYNRTHNPNCPPEGNMGNGAITLITEIPLCETKPIDFGVLRFCKTCGVCAEACPAGAIPTLAEQKEPSWEVETKPWRASTPDHKRYPNDSHKCAFWYMTNTTCGVQVNQGRPLGACGRCANLCVFSKGTSAMVHEVIKATTATSPLFNSFFSNMDRQFEYSKDPTAEERGSIWTSSGYVGPMTIRQ
ncbi:MAG: reductive dehalogenase [Dehalogenimonas sp.]